MGTVACLLTLLWCAVLLLGHWLLPSFGCAFDTSNCAQSFHKNGVYAGVLKSVVDHRPIRGMSFTVRFGSRKNDSPATGFSTDRAGRYCIVWASERATPLVEVNGRYAGLIDSPWTPLNGDSPPDGCQPGDQGIPWHRADDARSSPQWLAVVVLGFVSIVLLVVGVALGANARIGRAIRYAAIGSVAVTTALAAVVWLS